MLRKFGFAYSQADNIGQLVYRPKYAYNNSPLNSFQNEEVSDESCKWNESIHCHIEYLFFSKKSCCLWDNYKTKIWKIRQAIDDET